MLSKIISEENVKAAWRLIEPAERVVIISHMGPDGDAIGSTLGMYHFLRQLDKQPTVVLPNAFPAHFAWMQGSSEIVIAEENLDSTVQLLKHADLIVLIDFNEYGRVNGLKPLLEVSNVPKLLIDHHLNPDPNCANVIISHPEISSSSELVFRLICRMGFAQKIDVACAECVYTGMMTDTGGFSYNSNQPEIYIIVSELLHRGVDKDAIYKKLHYVHSEKRMRLMGYCLSEKMVVLPEYRTAIITLNDEELQRYDVQTGDTEGFVQLPFSIKGVVFSVFMREDVQRQKIRVSLRSLGSFPCNKLASELFHGGGHLNASGGDSRLSLKESVALLVNALPEYKVMLDEVEV